jgi:AcrR family transcriptional regulator
VITPPDDSTQLNLREAQSALARAHIAAAARQLFLSQGYVSTSMSDIGRQAGVAVQTIYNVLGNKVAVLSAVVDLVAAGPNAPRPVPVFMEERAGETSDLAGLVKVLADWFLEVHLRTADVFRLIRQAAALDDDVASPERARADQRLRNYIKAAAQVRARGGLTSGLTDEEAAGVIWSLGHPDTYRALVVERGWSQEKYRHWLATSLQGALR